MANSEYNPAPKLRLIAVNNENYWHLKDLGKAGDSFNDVITKLLEVAKSK
jgi:predicted CopG family antitoxin